MHHQCSPTASRETCLRNTFCIYFRQGLRSYGEEDLLTLRAPTKNRKKSKKFHLRRPEGGVLQDTTRKSEVRKLFVVLIYASCKQAFGGNTCLLRCQGQMG
ncbi:hypothetical protein CEXT_670931 [Caerostris extrusa]|uniref:Uncharacterized protein n=1 Tax=Caerostris extrusa TaxID=172846 RepID=A0AAV4XJF4_CAEEX|nr:hypothetical protein CEXT_670931 [Caerostris extrusa]